MKDKRTRKFTASTLITLLIVAMLIISGPAEAVRVMIYANDLNNRQVGETGFFYINVTIGANERIPITNLSVEGLPAIPGSPGGKLVFNISDFNTLGDYRIKDNYNISLLSRNGWVGGYGYGYGYANNHETAPYYGYGYGYQFLGYGYGYGYSNGYGYGYGNPNTYTELGYRVTVNTTGADPGTYDLIAKVNTAKGVVFQGSSSFTLTSDNILPASITNLQNVTYARTYINWTWDDPADIDFSKVMVYLDGTFKENVTKGVQYYNATGLIPGNPYEIGTRTVDRSGNINLTWVNHTSSTAPIEIGIKIKDHINLRKKAIKVTIFNNTPVGFDVAGIDISSVRFGPAAAQPFENDTKDGDLTLSFRTSDTGIRCGDTEATLTGRTYDGSGFTGSDGFEVKGCEAPPSSGGGGIGGGGGGGGGIAGSGEEFTNIEVKEKRDMHIYKNVFTSYTFTNSINPVFEVDIEGNASVGEITAAVEVLKATSTLVKKPAPGNVYKNINILVGASGFGTSSKIKDAVVRFRTERSWIASNDLVDSDIRLMRWDGEDWTELETVLESRDSKYNYYKSGTKHFSPFAIIGLKNEGVQAAGLTQSGVTLTTIDAAEDAQVTEDTGKFPWSMLIIAVFSVSLLVISLIRRITWQ